MTMRMPDRPVNPRRGKSPTIVVRPRGPSVKQKLFVFMAMLLLVTAGGAAIIWRKPKVLGLDVLLGASSAAPAPTTSGSGMPSGSAAASGAMMGGTPSASAGERASGPTITPLGSAALSASASASASAAASASAKKAPKLPAPR